MPVQTPLERFAAHARATPSADAIVTSRRRYSYREVDVLSTRVAIWLRYEAGLETGARVGLLADHSADAILSALGVWKAGMAYVPIDLDSPAERVRFVATDSQLDVLLADDASFGRAAATSAVSCFRVADCLSSAAKRSDGASAQRGRAAYVMYTSGTTGTPKGCVVTHENVAALFDATDRVFDFHRADRWTMLHSHAFDFSVWEAFGALVHGASVHIPPRSTVVDSRRLAAYLARVRASVLSITPQAFARLSTIALPPAHEGLDRHLRYVVFGGERLEPHQFTSWLAAYPAVELVNMYGITEGTVHTTYHFIDGQALSKWNGNSIIGKPLPGTTIYLCDERGQQVPEGEAGEIWVSGPGVCDGYLNRPALSNERFTADPFGTPHPIYKSGDFAKWLGDDLVYLGRRDDQVKIAGYRIELGEVRSALLAFPGVEEAAVVPISDRAGLAAFVVGKDELDRSWVMDALRRTLPRYMVPRSILQVATIPLTANGKVDFDGLRRLARSQAQLGRASGRASALQSAWEATIGPSPDWSGADFVLAGGDSLDAANLSLLLAEHGFELDEADILHYRRPRALQSRMRPISSSDPSLASESWDRYPLTHFQRKYVEHERAPRLGTLPVLLLTSEDVAVEEMAEAIIGVSSRHAILRSRVRASAHGYYHEADAHLVPDVRLVRQPPDAGAEELLQLQARRELAQPIDLTASAPMRAAIIESNGQAKGVALTLHHLAADRESLRIVCSELATLLSGHTLATEAEADFAGYAWHEAALAADPPHERLAFWRSRLQESAAIATEVGAKPSRSGYAYQLSTTVPLDDLRRLRTAAARSGSTLAALITAVFAQFVGAVTARRAVVVALTMTTRNARRPATAIGPYINHGLFAFGDVCLPIADVGADVTRQIARYQRNIDFPVEYFRYHGIGDQLAPLPRLFEFLVNFHSDRSDATHYGPLTELPVALTRDSMMRTATLNVYESSDSLRLVLRARRAVVDAIGHDFHGAIEPLLTGYSGG